MTKLFAIYVIRQNPIPSKIISFQLDLASFGFFYRGKVGELFSFSALTLAERTERGVRQSVECNSENIGASFDAVVHAYTNSDGLACVVITDKEYPTRVAYILIGKILEEFCSKVPNSSWSSATIIPTTNSIQFDQLLKDLLIKYQDPHQVDPILRVQKELNETKVVVHKTIEGVLNRGEKLENLIERSEQLSGMSKVFYKDAKKANACCSYFA